MLLMTDYNQMFHPSSAGVVDFYPLPPCIVVTPTVVVDHMLGLDLICQPHFCEEQRLPTSEDRRMACQNTESDPHLRGKGVVDTICAEN